jgi:hypothetical protein
MLMRKPISILLSLLWMACHLHAQKTLAAAGRTISLPNLILEYAVGEPAVSTLSLPGGLVTQGLLQPTLKSVPTHEVFDELYSFKCYPNPVVDFLAVETDYSDFKLLQFTDEQGCIVRESSFAYMPIDCASLPVGTYFVRLFSNHKPESKTFKLIKQ